MTCQQCGAPLQIGSWPFCPHGPTRNFSVIGDDWPGGKTFENLGHEPVTLYSKTEWKRELKARGLVHRDHHVPLQGGDTHPETTRWI